MVRTPECSLVHYELPGDEGRSTEFWWKHECIAPNSGPDDWANGWEETRLPLGGPNGWTLVSQEPLTIAPSIWCRRCDTHGFFENGSWRSV